MPKTDDSPKLGRLPEQLSFVVLAAVLVYLPFRVLIYTLAGHWGAPIKVVFFFQVIPELLLLLGLALVLYLRRARLPRPNLLISLALALFGWGVVTALYHPASLGQGWVGIRHDFLGLLALFLIWLAPPRRDRERLLTWAEWGIWLLAAVAVIEFVIGPSLFHGIGYDEHFVGSIPQLSSLLPAPIQHAPLLLIGVALLWRRSPRYDWTLTALAGFLIGLTYARSAWIATTLFGAGLFIQELSRRRLDWRPALLGLALLAGLTTGLVRYHGDWSSVLLHGKSTTEHVSASTQALKGASIPELLFGRGIGTAGPASFRTEHPRIAESWYLQLIQEIGLTGLALYLALLGTAVWMLFRAGEAVLGWLGLGLAANAAFLHIWADNPYLNLVWWILVGLLLCSAMPPRGPHQDPVKVEKHKKLDTPE